MPVYGIRRGKGGVYRPHNLPIVEAAVSAQESLFAKYTVSIENNLRQVIESVHDDGDHGHIPKARPNESFRDRSIPTRTYSHGVQS